MRDCSKERHCWLCPKGYRYETERNPLEHMVDGVIRDVAEVREAKFPVFARGIMPKPGVKKTLGTLNKQIDCGGVRVDSGDIVVADEEGIVVIPKSEQETVYQIALARMNKEAEQTLEEWQTEHHTKIEKILVERGFTE